MKRIAFLMTIGLLATAIYAADMPAQGFGLHIGYAQPTYRLNDANESLAKDSLVNRTQLHGFKIGASYDASIIKGFGSTIGINYVFGAARTEWKTSSKTIGQYPMYRSQLYYHALEVFVDWQYKFEVAQETYLMLYTGPKIQCGLSYKKKAQQDYFDNITAYPEGDNDLFDDSEPNEDLQRLNVTWGIGAGFQYQRYFIRGGYDFGLINPYKNRQFTAADGTLMDRNTRGRLDSWEIKIGAYLWYNK